MDRLIAQNLNIQPQVSGAPAQTFSIKGPLVGIDSISSLVNVIMSFVYPFAAVILLLTLIWGGYDFLTSQGESEKVNAGKAKMTAGIVGFILLAISYLLVRLIGFIFGVGEGIL